MQVKGRYCPVCGTLLIPRWNFWAALFGFDLKYDCPNCGNSGTWAQLVKAAHNSH